LFNRFENAQFVGAANFPGAPYEIVLQPASVVRIFYQFCRDGLNPELATLVAATVVFGFRLSLQAGFICLTLVLAGLAAFLPNSVLPNHYSSGYSFNASYLLFAPILILNGDFAIDKRWGFGAGILVIFALFSPAFSESRYESNAWTINQQKTQKHLLSALIDLASKLPERSTLVLVTGLDFPFSPFDHGYSLGSIDKNRRAHFDVLAYYRRSEGPSAFTLYNSTANPVHFIDGEQLELESYDQIWMFRNDGTLIDVVYPSAKSGLPKPFEGFSTADLIRFPRLIDLEMGRSKSGWNGSQALNGYELLQCGAILLNYNNLSGSHACLDKSVALLPQNPYPHFYLGNVLAKEGRRLEAAEQYSQAMSHDDPQSPNAAFKASLDALRMK
jgi:hypothetical protein